MNKSSVTAQGMAIWVVEFFEERDTQNSINFGQKSTYSKENIVFCQSMERGFVKKWQISKGNYVLYFVSRRSSELSKIGHHFRNKVFYKLEVSKNVHNKQIVILK